MDVLYWDQLDAAAQAAALRRPAEATQANRAAIVRTVLARVRAEGDAALRAYTAQFDGVALDDLAVPAEALATAAAALSPELRAAIDTAYDNIRRFHQAQQAERLVVETMPGVMCEQHTRPIERVGLYVPGGTAPLPSTALMLGVPAQLAGCQQVVLCTPPNADGSVHPAICYVAQRCGIRQVFRLGGAQAIAAMAYGTQSVPAVDKLFGPGNSWVTEAKQQAALDPAGALADLPAGPSEVLVIADASANPAFVAADLLSQAEHGPDSQVMLVTDAPALVPQVLAVLEEQRAGLGRAAVAGQALAHSRALIVPDLQAAVAVSNRYAPEHLIIQTQDPRSLLAAVMHAGSVFLGPWSPESVGDYASGTNHVLPTYGYARSVGGLSLAAFSKRMTVQTLTRAGLEALAPTVVALAEAEGLDAHRNAVTIRLQAPH